MFLYEFIVSNEGTTEELLLKWECTHADAYIKRYVTHIRFSLQTALLSNPPFISPLGVVRKGGRQWVIKTTVMRARQIITQIKM